MIYVKPVCTIMTHFILTFGASEPDMDAFFSWCLRTTTPCLLEY